MAAKGLTQNQEAYCQARLRGLSQRQAYREAYPRSRKWKDSAVDSQASRLEGVRKVSARLEQLNAQSAKSARLTKTRLLKRLDNLADKAEEHSVVCVPQTNEAGETVDVEYLDTKVADILVKTTKELLPYAQDDREEDGAALVPPFDLSAHISPSFCDVSRAIDRGVGEIILKGGRGSTKSSYAYLKGLDVFLSRPSANWLCVRQFANTLRRSCFANVLWAIQKRGMTVGRTGEDADFTVTVSPMEITYRKTGQQIIFSGLDDPEKVKSITFANGKKIEILTFEEYKQFRSSEDIRSVEYSTLRGDYGLEFKIFNPDPDEMDRANVEAREKEGDPNAFVHHSTWRDVPEEFLGKRFVENAERMYETNPEAARNELDGETVELTGRVFKNVEEQEITPEDVAGFKWIRRGVDWGYETDPWGMWDVAYDRKTKSLYIFGEEVAYHQRNEETAKLAKEHLAERTKDGKVQRTKDGEPILRRIPQNEIRCDIAEKKSIADFRAYGLDAVGASKQVPVIDGIRWLQNRRRIVIDRKAAPFAYQEFVRYRADVDAEGRFKDYPDKDNHSIDGVRYAVYDLIADPDCT